MITPPEALVSVPLLPVRRESVVPEVVSKVIVPAFVKPAIEIGVKVLWMQLGIVNEEAKKQAEAAGLEVVMDRCMKIEYGRLFGGLNWAGVNTGVISAKRPRTLP